MLRTIENSYFVKLSIIVKLLIKILFPHNGFSYSSIAVIIHLEHLRLRSFALFISCSSFDKFSTVYLEKEKMKLIAVFGIVLSCALAISAQREGPKVTDIVS